MPDEDLKFFDFRFAFDGEGFIGGEEVGDCGGKELV